MNQTITLSIVLSQILSPLAVSAANLEVDNGNVRYAPTIEMAPNQKVPLVNITAPSSGGLSHNKFLNYNVSSDGLILNNSNKTLVNTQLAGYIYGNKNLVGKDTAKVILNEVTSKNKTELRGYTEIAGDKASVIIANPNGVYINGAGFINTSHATITTGTPIINQDTGNLEHFRVIGGDIEIDGNGLNVSNLDRASLYSQALKLNAKLYANELDVITGDNDITSDGSNYTKLVSTGHYAVMSIDSTNLGGIYANKIKLLSTKDGIGVNLPIEVTASDNLYINADGQITLGTIIASNEASVTSKNGSIKSDTLYAKTITLEAKEDINNQNILASSDGITLNSDTLTNANFIATGVDSNLQKVNDDATLVINADMKVIQNGILFASDDITINTDNFINEGSIGTYGILSIKSHDATIGGNLQANAIQTITDNLTLQNSILMSTGTVNTHVKNSLIRPLSNTKILAYNIALDIANTDLNLDATNQIEATNDLNINTRNLINNTTLVANRNTTVTTHDLTNNNLISAGNTLSVNASGNIINNSNVSGGLKGRITNIDTVNLTNKGYISAQDAMNINASDTIKNIAAIGVSGEHAALTINADTILNYNTLYSSGDMTLRPVTLLKNATDTTEANLGLNVAVIYANDNINIEGVRGETTVENISATIQTQTEDISITAKELINKRSKDRNDNVFFTTNYIDDRVYFNEDIRYGGIVEGSQGLVKVQGTGYNDRFDAYVNGYGYRLHLDLAREPLPYHSATFGAILNERVPFNNPLHQASKIASGEDLILHVNELRNEISTVSAIEDLVFDNTSVTNVKTDYIGGLTITLYHTIQNGDSTVNQKHYGTLYYNGVLIQAPGDKWGDYVYGTFNVSKDVSVPSTIEAKNILGVATDIQNGITTNPNITIYKPNMNKADTTIISPVPSDAASQAITYSIPNNPYGMFVPSDPTSNHDYLIEANPTYTNIGNFVNSTYFYKKMGLDTDKLTKRLGDGAYETKLVTDAIINLTGRRMINDGFTTENAQFIKLMDNAVNISWILGLEIGKAPSAEQLANLTEDIVWMEEKVLNGQTVLVPVVYLAKDYSQLKGANIIANDTVDLSVSGNVNNNGNLLANNLVKLNASSITNNGGVIFSNGSAVLVSTNNMVNKNGGSVKAAEIAIASTNGSVVNETSAQVNNVKNGRDDITYTMMSKTSSIEATNGDLLVTAQKDIENIGANLSASSNIVLATNEGDINIKALETKTGHNLNYSRGFDKALDTEHLSSSANAGEHIIMQSAGDINLEASNLAAGGTVVLDTKENVNLIALNDVHYKDVQTTKKGSFGRSKTTRNMSYKESVVGSEIDASNIVISSGSNTTLQAANLKAQETIQVDAAGDINALAKEYREAELHYTKKKGFGGLSSSVSLDSTDAVKLHEATLKTEAKNIIMNSEKDINVVASNMRAGDTLGLKASQNVNILSDEEQNTEQHYSKKSGLSLGFSDNMLTYTEEKQTKDAKTNITQKSSTLSGNTIAIEAGQDMSTIGSNIIASTIDVSAQRDVNILSATESASHKHKESTAKAGIGVTLNINEASIFAGAITKSDKMEGGQTQEVGSGLVGDNITVHSGNNTNILASNVLANNDVSIQSDKNINILSQDATTYKNQVHEELKAGIKVGVQQHVTDTAKQLVSNAQSLPKSDNALNAASTVMRSIDLVSNTLSHSVSAGFDAIAEMSKSEISSQSISAQSSIIAAGHDVTLGAANKITVAGSDIMAENKISMDAQTITLKSSEQTASSSASDKSGSLKVTLFGTHTGQVDASYAQSKNRSNDTLQRDTYVSANDVAITTSGDTTLHGAHVLGNTVTVNVGGNLNLISVQDTGSSKGDQESIGLSTAGSVSIGAGKLSSSKAWVEEQTGIIAAKKADITVTLNTDIQGGIIATKDTNGNDANNVQLTTKTLTASDIADYDKSKSMSIGLGNISASSFQTNSRGTTGGTIEAGYAYSDKEQISRATIGGGTITLTNQESLPSNLNRDITKAQEITKNESENYDIYASQNSINSVLNPAQTAENWKQAAKDMGLSMHKEITENLPTESNGKDSKGDWADNTVGVLFDNIGVGGILPNVANNGGYITQIVSQLAGDNRNIIQSTTTDKLTSMGVELNDIFQTEDGHYVTNPNKTVVILADQAAVDNAKATGTLNDYKIYVTQDAAKSITHVFTNGILNAVPEALANGNEQSGGALLTLVNYNPSHGFLPDGAETMQDKLLVEKLGIGALSTGSAKQTGSTITQVAGIRDGKLTVVAHSEGTGETYAGMKYYEDELKALLGDKTTADFKVGFYGSPIGFENSSALVSSLYSKEFTDDNNLETYFRSSVNPGDPVGTLPIFLGGNGAGINNPSMLDGEFGYMFSRGISSIANGKDPTKPSPHSGYTCVIGCGDEMKTPVIGEYMGTNGNLDLLNNFYDLHDLNKDFANFNQAGDKNGKD